CNRRRSVWRAARREHLTIPIRDSRWAGVAGPDPVPLGRGSAAGGITPVPSGKLRPDQDRLRTGLFRVVAARPESRRWKRSHGLQGGQSWRPRPLDFPQQAQSRGSFRAPPPRYWAGSMVGGVRRRADRRWQGVGPLLL